MSESQSNGRGRLPLAPFIVEPSSRHTHSFILLHGLGSNGQKFGQELLDNGICSDGQNLTRVFPFARFIFPTAKRRRSSAFRRAMLTQWFDIASLDDPSHRSDTQLQGLEESAREILDLISQESREIPPKNIILGGLSQGCATALICLLALDFPIGGFVGMSGWLPFRHDIEGLVEAEDLRSSQDDPFGPDDEDPFATSDTHEVRDPAVEVLGYVRDLLCLNPESPSRAESALSTPVFIGHGDADDKINPSLGEDACRALRAVGFLVDWRSYKEQGHWYKIPDEIDDIVEFIRVKAGLTR